MIEDIMDFVKSDLLNFCLTDNTSKSEVINQYDLMISD